MGLEVLAFSGLKESPVEDDNTVVLNLSEKHPERADGLKDSQAYTYQTKFEFRAGALGAENWFNELARMSGWTLGREGFLSSVRNADSGPFWEMMFFPAEGVIGPVTSQKLLGDFHTYDDRARLVSSDLFYDRYQNWWKAFEMAINDGAVVIC